MSNFYTDNEDILFHFKNMDMDWIIELKEDNFSEKTSYPYAPKDINDAKDSYARVLEIIGSLAGDFIAPRAAAVDEEGVRLENGEVIYASGTQECLEMLARADLCGIPLPRKYGGLNFPSFIGSMAIEMVSRADAAFMNLFGLQDVAVTISRFGTEEIKQRFLPRYARGEITGSMALTEPDAGSDLQSVSLKATMDENGKWFLNGVKRFITNGCGKLSLVLARSEENTKDGRGLSLFVYERDEHMKIRRVENKLGIHGSPTCELEFNNAPCELLGKRKRGLSKYTMALMNGARLGIAAQALGIAEAAYRESHKYANEREQFGRRIRDIIPVYEMLSEMKISIEAGRSLLYESARMVDIHEGLENKGEKYPERVRELRNEIKRYARFAALLTPLVKAYNSEMCNRVSYDAIQVHGGTGYMKDFNVERHYRDARITSIYEGTTQLQVVAAVSGILKGTAHELLSDYETEDYSYAEEMHQKILKARNSLDKAVSFVKGLESPEITEYHSRRLTEMCTDAIQGYLLLRDASHSERKKKVAETFIEKMSRRVEMNMNLIIEDKSSLLSNHSEILGN